MNVGLASLFFAQMPKVQKVIGFELFKPTYDEGIFNLSLNKSLAKKIHPINIGLSDKSYTDVLDYSFKNKGRVGIHGTSYIKNPIVDKERISVRFEDAFKILSPLMDEHLNVILKIDTEGSELPILSSLHAGNLLKRFSLIMIEWHNHEDRPITEILKEADFSYFKINLKYDTGLIYAFRDR
jgi:FkbM family methyltransferase